MRLASWSVRWVAKECGASDSFTASSYTVSRHDTYVATTGEASLMGSAPPQQPEEAEQPVEPEQSGQAFLPRVAR